LFGNGSDVKYLAIVTNRRLPTEDEKTLDGPLIIRWHWQKAGTIELVHDVLKNDLAAGVMPCGRFGANAAWLRLNVLTFNVLSALKQTALPGVLSDARPKRLRLFAFNVAARLAYSGRELVAYLAASAERLAVLVAARRDLLALGAAAG